MSPIPSLPLPRPTMQILSSSVGRAKNMNVRIIKDAKNDGLLLYSWLGWLGRLSSACASCSGCVQKPFSAAAEAARVFASQSGGLYCLLSLSPSLAAAFKTEGAGGRAGWHVNTAYHGGVGLFWMGGNDLPWAKRTMGKRKEMKTKLSLSPPVGSRWWKNLSLMMWKKYPQIVCFSLFISAFGN